MNINTQTTDASIHAIRAAESYADLREAVRAAFEENAMVRSLTRGVMAALVRCPWLDEMPIANNFTEVMGYVKDAIIEDIGTIRVQDVAAIEQASRTWRPASDAQAAEAQTPHKHRMIADLKDIVTFIERAEDESLTAFRRFIEEHQRAQGAGALSLNEKYGIATARAVMADPDLAAVLDEEERKLIAHHRALKVYNNVAAGLRPDGTPDTDADTDTPEAAE